MKFLINLIFLSLLIFSGCGKKTSLERYPNSDYPKQYPNKKMNKKLVKYNKFLSYK